ncbi:hypothetical protein Godav_002383, partial [Gossypium davidsonii]|nr:hypothetical protein [Gossypium davidsonii]
VVRLAIDLGFQDVVIEGDSLTVIKKLFAPLSLSQHLDVFDRES